jgi:hypothetical protein
MKDSRSRSWSRYISTCLLVGKTVESLQHQNAEHQHGIVGRASAAAAVRPHQRRIQHRTEDLEVDHGREALQRIASSRKCGIPLIHIKEARLTCHRHCLR